MKLPPRSPNLNAYAERLLRSIKESCLERIIFFGEESLRTAIQNRSPNIIIPSAIIKAWRTNSSVQRLATSTIPVRSSGASAWAAC